MSDLSEIEGRLSQQLLAMVADDLTGATDTGLQFSKTGLRTVVYFDLPRLPGRCDVVVVITESRSESAVEAGRRATQVGTRLGMWNARHVYKKMDSTMRGNVGAETEALAVALNRSLVALTPAYPANGRTVVDGCLLVNGVKLAESEFARDPIWPMRRSSVAEILSDQTDWRIVEVGLREVRRGADGLAELFRQIAAESEPTFLSFDAAESSDLAQIAVAVARSPFVLPAGSAGLAEWLPTALGMRSPLVSFGPRPPAVDSALFVVGSVNPVARRQLDTLVQTAGVTVVAVSAARLTDVDARLAEIELCARKIANAIESNSNIALVIDLSDGPDALTSLANRAGLTVREIAHRIVQGLSSVVVRACPLNSRLGLAITGGDTAISVCRALGAGGLIVNREVAPGIPICTMIGGPHDGAPVVTKAGGFGEDDALVLALRTLKGERVG